MALTIQEEAMSDLRRKCRQSDAFNYDDLIWWGKIQDAIEGFFSQDKEVDFRKYLEANFYRLTIDKSPIQ